MKVIKLSFLFLAVVRQIHSQFNNLFNSAYSSNLLKKKPNSISSFFFQNENSQARSVSPRNSRYNLNPSQQIQQPSNTFLQNAQQQRQQFGVNYSSPATRVQFTPTSQQQVTNSQFLTANDITSQNVPQSQNQIQYAQLNQNRAFGGIPSRGEVQIGSPQNFSQQIQNQNLQNKIKPQDLSLANQLSFDFNSTQAQQALLNQQLQQQAQAQQQIPQQQQQPQQQIPQQQTLNQNQQTQQNSEPDLQALIQQLQNQQASQLIQQNQGQVQQSSNPGANNLDPEQQQLQLLLKQLSQNEQAQKPPQIKQETLSTELPEQSVPNKKRRPTPEELNQLKKKRKPPVQEEEDLLSQFFNDQSEGQLDEFFKPEEKPAPRPAKKRRPSTSDPNQNIDPPTSKKKSSSSSAGDINLFELFNNQGDSSQFGNSETQGEVVHYIDDPSQLNTNEPEVTSIDQFLQAGEIPGGGPGGMPF